MDEKKLCMRCMHESGGLSVCKHCGFVYDPSAVPPSDQSPGTVIAGRYILGCAARRTQETIQYVGFDQLRMCRVALYEYCPAEHVERKSGHIRPKNESASRYFRSGMHSFLGCMQSLVKMKRQAGLAPVYAAFEEGGTAYAIAELSEDVTLDECIRSQGNALMPEDALPIAIQLCSALSSLRKHGLSCSMLRADMVAISANGSAHLCWYPALRRYATRADTAKNVYSIGALLHSMLGGAHLRSGAIPEFGVNTPPQLEAVLSRALSQNSADRYPSLDELSAALKTLSGDSISSQKINNVRAPKKRALLCVAAVFFALGFLMIVQSFRIRASYTTPEVSPAPLTASEQPDAIASPSDMIAATQSTADPESTLATNTVQPASESDILPAAQTDATQTEVSDGFASESTLPSSNTSVADGEYDFTVSVEPAPTGDAAAGNEPQQPLPGRSIFDALLDKLWQDRSDR